METSAMQAESSIDCSAVAAWSDSADVLVVGFGMVGACAAIGAREGGGTPVQQACGFEDSVLDMARYHRGWVAC